MFYKKFSKRLSLKQSSIVDLQITDLLQLSNRELVFRLQCRHALKEYEVWKRSLRNLHPSLYPRTRKKGARLYREARDAVALYKFMRRKRAEYFKNYIDRLPGGGAKKRLAS